MRKKVQARDEVIRARKRINEAVSTELQSCQKGQSLQESRDIKAINRDRNRMATDIVNFTIPKARELLSECIVSDIN